MGIKNFLTDEEIKNCRKAEKWDAIGQVKIPISHEEIMLKNLAKQFKNYPVQWPNSKDRMYQLPYEDDLITAIAKEKAARAEEKALENQNRKPNAEPWTYQNGYLFRAKKLRESPHAFLINLEGFGTTWVPKSQVDYPSPFTVIWLPEWFMKEKGLTPDDAPPEHNPPFEWEPALIPKNKGGKNEQKKINE